MREEGGCSTTLLARRPSLRPFTSDYGDSVRPKWGDGLDFYNDEVKTQSGEGDVDLARPGCSLSPPRFPVVTNEPGTVSRVSEFLPMYCPHSNQRSLGQLELPDGAP